MFDLGMENLEKEDYGQAIYYFTQASKENSNGLDIYYYLSLAYLGKDNTKKACKCLELPAIRQHKKSVELWNEHCIEED